ncbi:hypothetical protein [Pseudomonas putida]|uniref:hypothetical protein n=1 Tax=Pseudomonas putida TaxID=303 RepID=UPI0018D90A34|nr:hypothetical protein [Pseudomonas putida]MBH3412566.1 hypothetical protein [Pseudomonas putida]
MKERPILFSGPMVRAILSGQKTVTRRVMKPQPQKAPVDVVGGVPSWDSPTNYAGEVQMNTQLGKQCPYGKPGDRLWVRETWYCDHFEVQRGPYLKPSDLDLEEAREDGTLVYAADGLVPYEAEQPVWKPSIHMPRWASRILLEVTDVRVERLQAISWEEALDEGIGDHRFECDRPVEPDGYPACSCGSVGYVDAFAELWNTINGKEAWDANPWVWIVEFKRIAP